MSHTSDSEKPAELPPEAAVHSPDSGVGMPTLDVQQLAESQSISFAGEPDFQPPAEALTESTTADGAVGAWHNSVKITSLWSNASARNAWAAVQGLGWRRINPANDSAFLNMAAMLSHAKQVNANCKVRIESDNLIHEVYVW